MGKSWFFPNRSTEATPEQLVVTGAAGGYGVDPIDGDTGYVQVGQGRREVPRWTLDKARAFSVAAYRSNPMARAIIDTYTSFCVGDSGVRLQCSNPDVAEVANEFWDDPKNQLEALQDALLRDHLLMGESVLELMVGPVSGVCRFSPIDPSRVTGVSLDRGNPLWPALLHIGQMNSVGGGGGENAFDLSVISIDDFTGLRTGQAMFWPSWKALVTDRRGTPFLAPILDELDAYDSVLSNLIDRTALARYLVWDVTVEGGQKDVDNFIKARGGLHVPRSGTVEVHNKQVTWTPQTAQSGSFEDTNTLASVLTNIAGGVGLAKTWLAEPGGANRATSLTMAEPVRRRVGGIQNLWLNRMTDLVRFAVDRAVAAGRLPATVPSMDMTGRDGGQVRASQTVRVAGPEIAAADAQITAAVMLNLSQALVGLKDGGILSPEAVQIAAEKAWEQFVGMPFRADLALDPNASIDDVATEIDANESRRLKAVGS